MNKKVNIYECKYCRYRMGKYSNKKWIKGYCGTTYKDVHLMLVKGGK